MARGISKERAIVERAAWQFALQRAAKKLGYVGNMIGDCDRKIVQAMGPIAWGRFYGESIPNESKEHVLMGLGTLMGTQRTLMRAARAFGDGEADKVFSNVPDAVEKSLRAR